MPSLIEPFGVEVLQAEAWPVPASTGAGVARILQAAVQAALDAANAPQPAVSIGGQIWISDRWQAELLVGDERHGEEAEFERGHHLLFRLAEFGAKALGATSLPAPAMHAFEDLATRSPGAMVAYLAGLGTAGAERRQHWQRAFELDPGMVAPRAGLAEEVLAAGGDASAVAGLVRDVAVHDPGAASRLGIALWVAGEAPAAAALLQAAVTGDPQDTEAMAALAALLARTAAPDTLDEALLLATQATQLAADDYRSWAALADVHRARGAYEEAGFYYGFALRLQPDSPSVLKDAGACWLMARNPSQALPLIERALAVAPQDAENHGNLAFVRAQMGEQVAALAAARKAAALRPGDARLRILHGDLAHAAGERDEALEAWARAAEIEPGMTISPDGGNIALGSRGDY